MALYRLIHEILNACPERLKHGVCVVVDADLYTYNPSNKTIYLDHHHPSVISTLHELGHHLYGESELLACRFSVWLFKEGFPRDYAKLKWNGHMLET